MILRTILYVTAGRSMAEQMARPTRGEAERLKEQGVFDVGISYLPLGWSRPPKHKFWDGYVPREEREESNGRS